MCFLSVPFLSGQDRVVSLVERGSVSAGCSCISKVLCWRVMNLPLLVWGNRRCFGFNPPLQTEIDVISLPVVPKEMFCSTSSPFRLSPIYVWSWGAAMKNHCHYHPRLRLAKCSSCGLMPTLTKVYFLDNMFLFGPTFFVFLSLVFFFFSSFPKSPLQFHGA